MTREQYTEYFTVLKEKYPEAKKINIRYYGSGDSFEEFYLEDIDGNYNSDFETHGYEDLLFAALDMSEANFNNDGSSGNITVNLEDQTLTVDNYWREMIEHPSGELTINANAIESGIIQPDDQIIM